MLFSFLFLFFNISNIVAQPAITIDNNSKNKLEIIKPVFITQKINENPPSLMIGKKEINEYKQFCLELNEYDKAIEIVFDEIKGMEDPSEKFKKFDELKKKYKRVIEILNKMDRSSINNTNQTVTTGWFHHDCDVHNTANGGAGGSGGTGGNGGNVTSANTNSNANSNSSSADIQ